MFVFSEMFLPLAVMAASGAGAWLCGKRKKFAAGIGTTGLILGIISWGVLFINCMGDPHSDPRTLRSGSFAGIPERARGGTEQSLLSVL